MQGTTNLDSPPHPREPTSDRQRSFNGPLQKPARRSARRSNTLQGLVLLSMLLSPRSRALFCACVLCSNTLFRIDRPRPPDPFFFVRHARLDRYAWLGWTWQKNKKKKKAGQQIGNLVPKGTAQKKKSRKVENHVTL